MKQLPCTLLAGMMALAAFDGGLLRFTIAALAWANIIVGVFNLVPGLPLDGGRVLQALIWGVTHRRHLGIVVAAWVVGVVATIFPARRAARL